MPLGEPGGPGGVASPQGMTHGIIGQPMLLIPRCGVMVQRRGPIRVWAVSKT